MIFNRLKFILIVALLASNLLVGVLSLYYLNSLNERYAALLDQSVPLINNLRTLTRELGSVQRLARRVVDPTREVAWNDLVRQLDDGNSSAQAHARVLGAMNFFNDTRISANILSCSADYEAKIDIFLDLVRSQKFTEANQYNSDAIRPAYERFMLSLDAAAAHVARQGSLQSANYAEESKVVGNFLLAFAGWPLLAVGALVIVMSILLILFFAAVLLPGITARRPVSG